MKVVLDTNIFVSAYFHNGNQRKVFLRIANYEDDNKILQCGIEGNVDYIITGDKDLLVLRDCHNIKIINTKDYLNIV